MKIVQRHFARRIFITLFPLVIGLLIPYIVIKNAPQNAEIYNPHNFIESVKVVIDIWGTLLGFIITVVSILVAFTGSKLTEEIKRTGHFKTVLYTYILTCFTLLIAISVFIPVIINNLVSDVLFCIFIGALIITLIDVAMCLVFLSLVVYTIFK
ncbi:hypothetical protein [Lacrimispora saccharolytica]|uniref:Uncharacterized protein n=1 Tax=Lacrimispora saccharolytica (strain ATCC 35040 / DSM 2544 / NRCC 2533 / WM1) TaxID=610130 RepID=D9R912_LACSW|nr:hypothetical protein [Lacrimispora saccharolytica]ADL03987.1 hypothetical protein Closa_1386 [[Clostridium] saccharolyticum WM1]